MNAADVLAYTYEADTHCIPCAIERFGEDEHGWVPEDAKDGEGNPIGAEFCNSEWYNIGEGTQTLACGTCGAVIDTYEEEPWGPEESDLVTEDYVNWYQDGKKVLVLDIDEENWKAEVLAFMNRNQFWPNVWWISDHGNPHLLSLKEED